MVDSRLIVNVYQVQDAGTQVECTRLHQAAAAVVRMASGEYDDIDTAVVARCFRTWLAAEGEISVERALRLPTTPAATRRLARDFWLERAARCIEEDRPWLGAVALARELEVFITRGSWRQWRGQADPPAGVAELQRALFHVAKLSGGETLSAKTIQRAAGHVFRAPIEGTAVDTESANPVHSLP